MEKLRLSDMRNYEEAYYQQSRSEMLNYMPEFYNCILEIGCGSGKFLKQLPANVEKWGVELNEKQAIEAAEHSNKILTGSIENIGNKIPNDHFDVIVCNDIIEHVADHDALFELIKKKLKKPGYIVGSIPNTRYYKNLYHLVIERDWRYENHGIRDRTHLRCFTEKSLKRTLTAHMFRIEKFEGLNQANIITMHPKSWLKNLFFIFFSIIFIGRQNDMQFSQFAFRGYIEAISG